MNNVEPEYMNISPPTYPPGDAAEGSREYKNKVYAFSYLFLQKYFLVKPWRVLIYLYRCLGLEFE